MDRAELKRIAEDIAIYADGAKAVHAKSGFDNPQNIVEALKLVAEALEMIGESAKP